MKRRGVVLMFMCAGLVLDACGDEAFSVNGNDDDGGVDASTNDGGSSGNDASTDGSISDGGIVDATPPDPDLLAAREDNPNDLVLRNGVLYWTTFSETLGLGGVRCINADGTGSVRTVAAGTHANRLAVDDTQAYWTDNGAGVTLDAFIGISALTGGGGPSIINTTLPAGIAVDANSLYVQFSGEAEIEAYSKDGQFFDGIITQNVIGPVSLAVDPIGLTWTNFGLTGAGVVGTTLLDGSLLGAATPLNQPWGVALDGPTAFLTVRDQFGAPNALGNIDSFQRDGSMAVTLTGNEAAPYFLTVDATNIYWTDEGSAPNYLDGTVRRMAKVGGTPISVAVGQHRPHGIAIDATYVYWADYTSGEIRRLRKP